MITFFRKMFGLCNHKWEIHEKIKLFKYAWDTRPCSTKLILQCSICGNIKKKVV